MMAETTPHESKPNEIISSNLCASCKTSLENPFVLPCMHALCGPCSKKVLTSQRARCPVCFKFLDLDKPLDLLPSTVFDTINKETNNSPISPPGSPLLGTYNKVLPDPIGTIPKHMKRENPPLYCGNCFSPRQVINTRCGECGEMLCGYCICTHKKLKVPVLNFNENNALKSIFGSSIKRCNDRLLPDNDFLFSLDELKTALLSPQPPVSLTYCRQLYNANAPCQSHQNSWILFYCTTCLVTGCTQCMTAMHKEHRVVSIREATEFSKKNISQMMCESRYRIKTLDSTLSQINTTVDAIQNKSLDVHQAVLAKTQLMIQALKDREERIISRIQSIKKVKEKSLTIQAKTILSTKNRLNGMLDAVSNNVNNADFAEVIHTEERVRRELDDMISLQYSLKPHENDYLELNMPEDSMLRAIANLGNFSVSGYAPNTIAVGVNTVVAIQYFMCSFSVHARDHLNERCTTGGENIIATMVQPNDVKCSLEVEDLCNGKYRVHYRPLLLGRHVFTVRLRGMEISGSPFSVEVKPQRNYLEIGNKPKLVIGERNRNDVSLARPWGVHVCADGFIYLTDRSKNRVTILNHDTSIHHHFGNGGDRPGEFNRPSGITVDRKGRVIVVDKDNHRMQIFSFEGDLLHCWGQQGSAYGDFFYPWDVDVNSEGKIVVSDTRNHRIQVFTPEGRFICAIGAHNSGSIVKLFECPRGVCWGPNESIVLTDFNQHYVVVIEKDRKNSWRHGSYGNKNGQFMRPQGVAKDVWGNLFVTDSRGHRIQMFGKSGNLIHWFGKDPNVTYLPGVVVPPEDGIDKPTDVAISPDGTVYIVEFCHSKLHAY